MIVPGYPKPRHGNPVGVALARLVDGRWQLHPSLFSVTSFANRVRQAVPRCFEEHPPLPSSPDREDPSFPLWALPRSPAKGTVPAGIPADVVHDLHRLAVGACAALAQQGHTPFRATITRVCDGMGPRWDVVVQTIDSFYGAGKVVGHQMEADAVRAALARWVEEGRLSPKAVFCHPNLRSEDIADVWFQQRPPTAHALLDGLAFFLDSTGQAIA